MQIKEFVNGTFQVWNGKHSVLDPEHMKWTHHEESYGPAMYFPSLEAARKAAGDYLTNITSLEVARVHKLDDLKEWEALHAHRRRVDPSGPVEYFADEPDFVSP